MPVPTSGASATSSGTAWRCMFEPISARFASSCSRNGIIAVATDQICSGETSTRSTSFGATVTYWPACVRQTTSGPFSLPVFSSTGWLACAISSSASCVASRRTISSVTTPSLTTRYGVVTKPKSLTSAKLDSEPIRPMFGPSGVSIGHMRP